MSRSCGFVPITQTDLSPDESLVASLSLGSPAEAVFGPFSCVLCGQSLEGSLSASPGSGIPTATAANGVLEVSLIRL